MCFCDQIGTVPLFRRRSDALASHSRARTSPRGLSGCEAPKKEQAKYCHTTTIRRIEGYNFWPRALPLSRLLLVQGPLVLFDDLQCFKNILPCSVNSALLLQCPGLRRLTLFVLLVAVRRLDVYPPKRGRALHAGEIGDGVHSGSTGSQSVAVGQATRSLAYRSRRSSFFPILVLIVECIRLRGCLRAMRRRVETRRAH